MNSYICFYNRRQIEVQADTTYQAQCLAAEKFNIKASKAYQIATVPAFKPVDTTSL